jgi:hypothetical protein
VGFYFTDGNYYTATYSGTSAYRWLFDAQEQYLGSTDTVAYACGIIDQDQKFMVSLDSVHVLEWSGPPDGNGNTRGGYVVDLRRTISLVTPEPVPEPASLFLLGAGLISFGWFGRKSKG